jgi:hypothetical protein
LHIGELRLGERLRIGELRLGECAGVGFRPGVCTRLRRGLHLRPWLAVGFRSWAGDRNLLVARLHGHWWSRVDRDVLAIDEARGCARRLDVPGRLERAAGLAWCRFRVRKLCCVRAVGRRRVDISRRRRGLRQGSASARGAVLE